MKAVGIFQRDEIHCECVERQQWGEHPGGNAVLQDSGVTCELAQVELLDQFVVQR